MHGTLSHIVGNESLKKRLSADIRHASLAHAYIIEGKKGCGKHTVARTIAAATNCLARKTDPGLVPCGTCENCRRIFSDISQDIITVTREEDKVTMGVDTVRTIRATVATVPAELERKVYIIEDADTMTSQAQNALLLTLEEPPSFVLFLLLCENARNLLETIRSRAPSLRVEPLDRKDVDAYLCRNDSRASVTRNTAPEEYAAILTAADGSIGEALRLLDSKERKLFLKERESVTDIITACMGRQNSHELLSALSAFPKKRAEIISRFALLMTALRDLLALSKADTPHLCFYTDAESAAEIAARFSLPTLAKIYTAAEEAIDALLHNANVSLTLLNFSVAVSA